ncbi:hypothetical protein CHL67_00395 [Prosthecochloris sp. GSB1]|uniref:DUF2914 domain-containing protein n=1 Tax=Prosthecochloris sp. GSB1 TaxID=281093 RepID=UPI000B8CD7F9|nr:DUF2914 domain-containing protein [Prosthecochloris sp. GSB1]ASQ89597.1 hypothetical protein CHL67_00395 [Prosthecochloris sp. GSB1]
MKERSTFGPDGVKLVGKLVEARESLGLTLDDISAKTRIRKEFLRSIESGDLSLLPSVYVHVFLKKYARTVGFRDWGLVERCRKEFGIPSPSTLAGNAGDAVRDEELQDVADDELGGNVVTKDSREDIGEEAVRPLRMEHLLDRRLVSLAVVVVVGIAMVFALTALVRSFSGPFSGTASFSGGSREPAASTLWTVVDSPGGTPVVGQAAKKFRGAPGAGVPAASKAVSEKDAAVSVPDSEAEHTEPDRGGFVLRSAFSKGFDEKAREPVGQLSGPVQEAGKVYYFSEVLSQQGKRLYHLWEYEGRLIKKISVGRAGSSRWRVWSEKTLPSGMTGTWTVKVVTGDGALLHSESIEYNGR